MPRSSKRIPILLILLGSLSVGTVGGAAAQDATPMAAGQDCVGTWQLRITALGQPASTSRAGVATFAADGTFTEASQPVVPGPPDAPENVSFSSSGHGVWQTTETGACAVTFVFYNADGQGNLLNTIEIRIVLLVGPDGNTMTTEGTDYATVTAPDGTVLFSGPGNTVEGTRLEVKLAPVPSSSPTP